MNRVILPTRSREYGVGKEMVDCVYLHRLYEDRLGEGVRTARAKIPAEFDYAVVKYNRRTEGFSFIASPDFDTNPEPIVGDSWNVLPRMDARFRAGLADPYIYHHKWLMVAEDYDGFDVGESEQRSRAWLALKDMDKSRIGRQSYWITKVLPRLIADRTNTV